MEVKTNYGRNKDFPVISMADIVLLLIIFFILTSTYVIQPGVKVALPRSATKQALSTPHIAVTVTKEGRLYLEEKPVSLEELSLLIRGMHPEEKYVLLKTDKAVTMDMAVKVMDNLRLAGAKKFVIATIPKD